MRSPRLVRPHSIVIYNKLADEVGGRAAYKSTKISNVAINTKIKSSMPYQSSINLLVQDEVVVTIDLSDAPKYVPFNKWEESAEGFTIHTEGDYLTFNDTRYAILAFKEIIPFKKYPEFIELTCQRE